MKIKRIFFYIILIIMFIIPAKISAADYKVCVYQKELDQYIYGVAHVVGGKVNFDVFRGQTGFSQALAFISSGATGSDIIKKTCNLLNEDQNPTNPLVLTEGCPATICEKDDGEDPNITHIAWIDNPCNGGTNKFNFLKQMTEASVASIDNAIAFSFNGSKANTEFSSMILGTCPSEVGPFKLLGGAYSLLKIIAPIGLVLFATLDIAKAVAAGDDGKVKKAQQAAMKRLIAAMIVFLSFVIVQYIVKLTANGSDMMSCVSQIIG